LKLVNFGQTKIFLCGLGSGGAMAMFAAQVLLNEQVLDEGQDIICMFLSFSYFIVSFFSICCLILFSYFVFLFLTA
jgi:hypothetical protein